MENGKQPVLDNQFEDNKGLTKREYFAGLAMQGLATKKPSDHEDDITRIVRTSVLLSDALLAELEKTKQQEQ
jgi:uncharacterized protein YqhQ